LPDAIASLISARNALRAGYGRFGLSFTLDGTWSATSARPSPPSCSGCG
jgi:hypothetical protein